MAKKFSFAAYDRKHLKNLLRRATDINKLLDDAAREGARIGQASGFTDPKGEFAFDKFPAIKQRVDELFKGLHDQLYTTIDEGNREEWLLSVAKNDALVDSKYSRAQKRLGARAEAWHEPHLEALEQFNARKERGMDLSDRVWKLTNQFKGELELALEMGLGDGKSAADLSRDVREYLREPHRLFRRVRNEKGQLRLSKAAQAYHPGQGVYRSSYKNALRLTATENNMAYRTADHERWNDLDFVIGIEIMLSNNHPIEDICDEMCGVYPKTFKFVGWHPFCRCIAVPKLADEDEFIRRQQALIDGEEVPQGGYAGEVTEMPQCFNNWVQENAERIENATSEPYFIRDNRAAVQKALSGGEQPMPKSAPKPTIEEIAAKRHANRDEEAIQEAWNKRRMEHFRAEQDRYDLTDAQKQQINDIFDRLNDANFFDPRTEFNPIWEELQKIFEPIRKAQLSATPRMDTFNDALNSTLAPLMTKAAINVGSKLEVQALKKPQTIKEIIERLGGGDQTEGSCSSLALAYAGNRAGLDVLDFRDGASREFFATRDNIMALLKKCGGTIENQISDFASAKTLLGAMVTEGHEYYFCCGGHAAVVRKVGEEMQFLELQTNGRNGWKKLDDDVLKWRFGAKQWRLHKGKRYGIDTGIIDITKLTSNKGYKELLGYINTDAAKQVKGKAGGAK
ncbi:MAG: hypothetical protein NC131_12780 [Roseburia sp.]|nr:hypothetical protein [Roseburia sp.]